MKNEFVAVYITTKDQKEAKKLGQMLLKERLAGCINIIPRIESMYW
jgi:periplasmic divalent cation tolerance protein